MTAPARATAAGFAFAAALAATAPAAAHGVGVKGKEFAFMPKRVEAEAGEPVEIAFENVGRLSHNLTIPAFDVKTETIQAGNTATIRFTPDEPGTYKIECTVPGHSEAGMTGKLIVKE